MVSKRQIEILNILQSKHDYEIIENVAREIGYSTRTVRNDLVAIRSFLQENKMGELITKPGYGVLLKNAPAELDTLIYRMETEKPTIYDHANDHHRVISALMEWNFLTIEQLSYRLYASSSRVRKILDDVEIWFNGQNIQLIKRRGRGIGIVCDEFSWRNAMWEFFKVIRNNEILSSNIYNDELAPIPWLSNRDQLLMNRFVNIVDLQLVASTVAQFLKEQQIEFNYESLCRIVFLLSLSIVRNRKNITAKIPDENTVLPKSMYEYNLARNLLGHVAKMFKVDSSSQTQYLMYIIGLSEIHNFLDEPAKECFLSSYSTLQAFARNLILYISSILQIPLQQDKLLEFNLLLYLRSAIHRLNHDIYIENPLLEEIKIRYPNIYGAVWSVSVLFETEWNLSINDAEIAFLVLHIAGAIERITSETQVLIVCNDSASISQLLKERIAKIMYGLKVEKVITSGNIAEIRSSKSDFIVSTVPLKSFTLGKEIIFVDSFLHPGDIRNIIDISQKVRKHKMQWIALDAFQCNLNSLFDPNLVYFLYTSEIKSKEHLLRQICLALYKHGYITRGFLNSVLAREIVTSTEVGSQVAVPHGNPRFVIKPVVAIAILDKPITWHNNRKVDLVFMLAFNSVKNGPQRPEIVRFYSVFAAFLEHPAALSYLRGMSNTMDVSDYMNNLVKGVTELS